MFPTDITSDDKRMQFVRFCITGCISTALHWGIYCLLLNWCEVNIAYTIGYVLSFLVNFTITSYWTFHTPPSLKRFTGFGGSHLANYFIQLVFLNVYIYLGIPRQWAALMAMGSAVPINFFMVRFVLTKDGIIGKFFLNLWQPVRTFLTKPFFQKYGTLLVFWLILAVVAGILKMNKGNNIMIYRYVFFNLVDQLNLYLPYPEKFGDLNHYGPAFSLVIAPFALLPRALCTILWNVTLTVLLYVSVRTSRFSKWEQLFILWFAAHDLLTCLFMQQFNIAVAALILLSFTLVEREKDFAATFCIAIGVFVKLLGVVGLVFFFFSKHKGKFILGLLLWSALLFVLPMLLSSPDYVISQYGEWYHSLLSKNSTNIGSRLSMNNVSLLGFIRRLFDNASYSDMWIILVGLVVETFCFFRISQWKHVAFRKMVLVQMLLFVILFSTGTENSSYVIAAVGIALWYSSVPWKRNKWDVLLIVVAFIASLFPTDIFPASLRHEVLQPYSLRAVPVIFIWLKLSYEMLRKDYSDTPLANPNIIDKRINTLKTT